MHEPEFAAPEPTRLAANGDIEVFDGQAWVVALPLSEDLSVGHRPAGGEPTDIARRELLPELGPRPGGANLAGTDPAGIDIAGIDPASGPKPGHHG